MISNDEQWQAWVAFKNSGPPRILLLEAFSSEGSQPTSALKCKLASSGSAGHAAPRLHS